MSKYLIEAKNLTRVYHRGSETIHAIDNVTLNVQRGEFISFVGPSGSGKTTLINLMGCLDNPTSGTLSLADKEIFGGGITLSERVLTRIRRNIFGYIFQNFYLIPTLTVRENVSVPLVFYKKKGVVDEVDKLLELLGIGNRADHLPAEISGGEMQRVAIARALVNRPEILLADEPTGNLDTVRSDEVGHLLSDLNKKIGVTIIMVTHNPAIARLGGRIINVIDGRISEKTSV